MIPESEPKLDRKRLKTAAEWHALLISEHKTAGERRAFSLWLETDLRNQAAYDHICDVLEGASGLLEDDDMVKLRRQALKPYQRRTRKYAGIAAAACLIFGVGLFAVLLAGSQNESLDDAKPTLIAQNDELNTKPHDALFFETAIGERSSINLPDGSTVELNTNSAIRYNFSPDKRIVSLIRGQALFDVAHDNERPFEVLASGKKIRALGTQFEVRIDKLDVSVTLIEGSIEIDDLVKKDVAKPEKKVILEPVKLVPGEQYVETREGQIDIRSTDVNLALQWRSGRLVFRNEELRNIVNELNRYSTSQIIINDPSLGDVTFGGNFKAGASLRFAYAVQGAYPIEITQSDSGQKILISWSDQ